MNHLYTKRQQKLCALLKECRLEAGLTQQQLAKRLKRSDSYISYVETGERNLRVLEFVEYVESLGGDPERLLAKALR